MVQLAGDYRLAQLIRRRVNRPASAGATPTTEDIVLPYVAGRAREQESVRAASERASLRGRRLSLLSRLEGERLSDIKGQLPIATGIQLANLGVTGLAGWQVMKRQERMEGIQERIVERMETLYGIKIKTQERIARSMEHGAGSLGFDPEGQEYDYETARKLGLGPDSTGHWPSRAPQTGLILKGRKHQTWDKTMGGEVEAGYQIMKRGKRYFSVPIKEEASWQ